MGCTSLGSSTNRVTRSGSTTSYRMGPMTVSSGSGSSRRLARTVICSTPREVPGDRLVAANHGRPVEEAGDPRELASLRRPLEVLAEERHPADVDLAGRNGHRFPVEHRNWIGVRPHDVAEPRVSPAHAGVGFVGPTLAEHREGVLDRGEDPAFACPLVVRAMVRDVAA